MLTGLKLLLDTTDPLFSQDVAHRLEEAQAMVNSLITSVRKLSLDLHPAILDDLGLHPALLWLYERYTLQTGIHVAFDHHGLDQRFLPEVETAAFRIVQEALTNVARHAHVNQVTVEVQVNQDTLRAKIEDHGIGFTRTAASTAAFSMGLTGMSERTVSLGGRLTVESAPGIGTCVTAEFPIDNS
jgi:signal transduction histidine kinase